MWRLWCGNMTAESSVRSCRPNVSGATTDRCSCNGFDNAGDVIRRRGLDHVEGAVRR